MKTEKQLQQYMRKEATKRGVGFDKLESRSRAGFPDVMLYHFGRVMFAEVKSEKGTGRLSRLQQFCIDDLRGHGLLVFVISSVKEVDELLDLITE